MKLTRPSRSPGRREAMRVRITREDGVALVVAMLVSFVVMVLGTTVVSLSMHNAESSSQDRKRVQAIASAEAGIDYYLSYLQNTGGQSPACSVTMSVPTTPPGSFTVTPIFYNAALAPMACPLTATPSYVLIRSAGRSNTAKPTRTMDAYARLTQTQGISFDNYGALFGDTSITFRSNASIGGSQYNDADVYTNGSFSLLSNSTIYGRVYAQGNVSMAQGSEIKQDLWANGSITLRNSARVRGAATSSTSSISLINATRVYGNAKAGTTITGGTVDGYRTQNTPSAAPPVRTFPVFTYNATDWTAAGYTERIYPNTCSTAASDLANWFGAGGGNYVVRIVGGCALNISANVTVRGNLGIISDGSVSLANNVRFLPAAGTGPWNVYLMAGLTGAAGCNVTFNNNAGMNSGLVTMLYASAACSVNMNSHSGLATGQILGGVLDFRHTAAFQYARITIPGGGSGGFKQDVSYRREVSSP